jgi:anthranilate phosphoribosyltransferase
LLALGVNLEPDIAVLEKCLAEAKLCFLFAPRHHPAMRHVAEVRKKLGVRTIFNLLGPLTNPARVKRHLIGVFSLDWLGPMAEVLKALGSEAAWLAHGHDGMDEITTTTATDIVELDDGMVRHFTLEPEQVGLPRTSLESLKGGDAAHNADEIRKLLRGEKGPYRDVTLFNAAAALIIAGKAKDLKEGVRIAKTAIDNGQAQRTLDLLVQLTHGKSS